MYSYAAATKYNLYGAFQQRSSKACDHCRRAKTKCARLDVKSVCHICARFGIKCTTTKTNQGPGTAAGYKYALERRLREIEALLGLVISSDDPRACSLVNDLSRDQLTARIIYKVQVGPFGPLGRQQYPSGPTKQDIIDTIMDGLADDSQSRHGEVLSSSIDVDSRPLTQGKEALVCPDHDWQDRLRALLNKPAISQYNSAPVVPVQHARPNSPAYEQQQQYQQPNPSYAQPPIQSADTSMMHCPKPSSIVSNPSMLALMNHPSQQWAEAQFEYPQYPIWGALDIYQRLGDGGSDDGDHSTKGHSDLDPSDPGKLMNIYDH